MNALSSAFIIGEHLRLPLGIACGGSSPAATSHATAAWLQFSLKFFSYIRCSLEFSSLLSAVSESTMATAVEAKTMLPPSHSCGCCTGSSQNEPLFLRTYTDAEGEEEEDANLRLHNIVHSSLDVVGERKGAQWVHASRRRSSDQPLAPLLSRNPCCFPLPLT